MHTYGCKCNKLYVLLHPMDGKLMCKRYIFESDRQAIASLHLAQALQNASKAASALPQDTQSSGTA